MKKTLYPVMLFLFLLTNVFASTNTSISTPIIGDIVDGYFSVKNILKSNPSYPCYPSRTSCLKTACEKVGQFECDSRSELSLIRRACRGVFGGNCVENATKFLGRFEYDSNYEMVKLLNSCRGLYDFECVEYTCDKLGNFGCDSLNEIVSVNRACAGDDL